MSSEASSGGEGSIQAATPMDAERSLELLGFLNCAGFTTKASLWPATQIAHRCQQSCAGRDGRSLTSRLWKY